MPPKQAKPSAASQKSSQEALFRETALKHAHLLQEQKDIQNNILDTIIEFLDLPSLETADPAQPSSADTVALKKHLPSFQQRDYDDLITERNISDKCGYVLCPRPVKKDSTTATDRIIWGTKGSDLKVVPRSELEKWCSQQCAERAAFIRAQLNESPAWVTGSKMEEIVLLDEVKAKRRTSAAQAERTTTEEPVQTLADEIRQLAIQDGLSAEDEAALRRVQQLALERGKAKRSGNADTVRVLEHAQTKEARPPVPSKAGGAGSVEGYQPKGSADDDDDDDSRDIIDL